MAKVVIGVCGSIAAYKMIKLTHEMIKSGHEVRVILTQTALKFVTPASFSAFGADVFLDDVTDDCNSKIMMQHINLAKWPDLIIIAPATANTIAKLATGIADNLLLSVVIASIAKIIVIPAMNKNMWAHWTNTRNVKLLLDNGVRFIGPTSGLQACGDDGEGRLIEPEDILCELNQFLFAQPATYDNLTTKKIVITLGPTREYIDPVRFISNSSSGKMGYELAKACMLNCQELVLIVGAGAEAQKINEDCRVIYVDSANEMYQAAIKECHNADIFISCAAVCDYAIEHYSQHKLKKSQADDLTLKLVKNVDIVSQIKLQFPKLFVVGFAAETEEVIKYAKHKLVNKNLDLIVANEVGRSKVFNSEYTAVSVIDKSGTVESFAKALKKNIALEIMRIINSLIVK